MACRGAPNRYLCLMLLTAAVTVCVCLASSVLLFLAPQTPQHYKDMAYTRYPSLLLVVTALLALLCLVLGCCGLSWDSKTTLILYTVVSILAVSGGLLIGSGAVLTFTLHGEVEHEVGGKIKKEVLSYSNGNSSDNTRVNNLQRKLKCCGIDSYKDWREMNTTWKREAGRGELAPESCCRFPQDNCTTNTSQLYHQGCLEELMFRLKVAAGCVFAVCVLTAALNVGSAALSCHGAWIIRKYQSYSIF